MQGPLELRAVGMCWVLVCALTRDEPEIVGYVHHLKLNPRSRERENNAGLCVPAAPPGLTRRPPRGSGHGARRRGLGTEAALIMSHDGTDSSPTALGGRPGAATLRVSPSHPESQSIFFCLFAFLLFFRFFCV